ncbi:MAG: response regulator [Spirochaetes bacterium]|nr:response regulator [Spirochaetota bacterium]
MKRKKSILIVDDDESLRKHLARMLASKGYDTRIARDGREAINLSGKQTFDMVILDIKMPILNGLETFKEIKKSNPKIICIMMTGYSAENLIKEASKEGVKACISKPFKFDAIKVYIDKYLH